MKLTEHQHKKLLDAPIGTGWMIFKLDESTIRMIPFNLNKDGKTFYWGVKHWSTT